MSITFACGHCGKVFTIDDKFAGKKGKCKQCGALMEIPGAGPSTPAPAPASREAPPSRRAPTSGPDRREISPSRRSAAPSTAPARSPQPDVFGFDDDPPPLKSAVTELDEEDFEPAGSPRLNRLPAGAFDPPKKKKKKKKQGWDGHSPLMIVGRIALGLSIGSVGVFFSYQMIRGVMGSITPGLAPRSELDRIMKERVDLHRMLTEKLTQVTSEDEARAASAVANQGMRAITRNLRKLQVTKALQTDIEAMKRQYTAPQEQAGLALAGQILRIRSIPGAWEALKLDAAIEELASVERSIPGLQQVQLPQNLSAAPTVTPPAPSQFNPPAPPKFNPPAQPGAPPGFRNRPGSRRPGMPRPGGPPGFGGPG